MFIIKETLVPVFLRKKSESSVPVISETSKNWQFS
jgi:hypothetical protein